MLLANERRVTELSIFGSKFLVKEALARDIPMGDFYFNRYLLKHKYLRLMSRMMFTKTKRPIDSFKENYKAVLDALFTPDGVDTDKSEDANRKSFHQAIIHLRKEIGLGEREVESMTQSQLCYVINVHRDMYNPKGAEEINEKKRKSMASRIYKQAVKEGLNKRP